MVAISSSRMMLFPPTQATRQGRRSPEDFLEEFLAMSSPQKRPAQSQ